MSTSTFTEPKYVGKLKNDLVYFESELSLLLERSVAFNDRYYLLKAVSILLIVSEVIQSYEQQHQIDNDLKKVMNIIDQYPQCFHIMQQYNDFEKLHSDFGHMENWNLVSEKGDQKVWYRLQPNDPIVEYRMEAVLEGKMINLVALICELDLLSLWIPFMNETVCLGENGHFERFVYMASALPRFFPISNRDFVFHGIAADYLDRDNSILVSMQPPKLTGSTCTNNQEVSTSISTSSEHCQTASNSIQTEINNQTNILNTKKININDSSFFIPGPKPNFVRLEIHGGFKLVYLSENKFCYKCIVKMDPRMPFVSTTLLNWFGGKFCGVLLTMLKRFMNNFDTSPYVARMEEDKEFYNLIEERFEAHRSDIVMI